MKNILAFTLFALALAQFACNPDCEQIYAVGLPNQSTSLAGHQIFIPTNAANVLKDRKFKFGKYPAAAVATTPPGAAVPGLIVTLPGDIEPGEYELKMEDPDCEDIVILRDFQIVDTGDYVNTGNFIFPAPPFFIVPTLPHVSPPLVQNAWFSPQNSDYCIWMQVEDFPDGSESIQIEPDSCAEVALCDASKNYHLNPVTGYIDKESNQIYLNIDRSSKNLGSEAFTGRFLDSTEVVQYGWDIPIEKCNGGMDKPRQYWMLLTSLKTGRQLILYQQR